MKTSTMAAIAIIGTAAWAAADDNQSDLSRLQGRWRVVGLERNGNQVPDEQLKRSSTQIAIEGRAITFYRGGKEFAKGTLAIDASKKPKWLDLKATRPDGKSETGGGIYEFDGDKLRLCLTAGGNPRPVKFETGERSLSVLYLYERVKAE